MFRSPDRRSAPAVRPVMEKLEDRLVMSAAPVAVPVTAALTTTTTTAATTASAATSFGGVLQAQNEFSRDHALADLVKASSGFRNLSGGFATTDANGYPTQDFVVPLWGGSNVDVGRYTVSFTGAPSAVVSVSAGRGTLTKVGTTNGVTTYNLDVPAGSTSLSLKFTNTGGLLKNLHVLQPGSSLASPWTPKFVKFLKSLAPDTLRMMDIVSINNNTTSTWAQRPKPTDATYNRAGVSWEDLINLCNQVGSGIWVCVPAHATDDYVTQLATLLKNNLNASGKIYIEYSNEVWNQAFEQGKYNLAQTKAELATGTSNLNYDGNTNVYDLADRRTARRLLEITNLFKSVWTKAGLASPINTRVRAILGNQAVQPTRADNMAKFIAAKYGAPSNYFWGVGVALYFQLNKYADQFVNGHYTALTTSLTVDQALEGMNLSVSARTSSSSGSPTSSSTPPPTGCTWTPTSWASTRPAR